MTAIISIVYDDCIQLLTDGAAYQDGILREIVQKFFPATSLPFVVTGRGNYAMVAEVAKRAIEFADRSGSVDAAFDWLQDAAQSVASVVDAIGANHFEIIGLGYSETEGFVQKALSSHPENGFAPGVLQTMGKQLLGAPRLTPSQKQYLSMGEDIEADRTFLERRGVEIMEFMRQDLSAPTVSFKTGGEEWSTVGGHCALTTITRTGSKSRILKRWNDLIGEKINPYRDIATVTVLGNRKERRAARRRAA